MTTKTTHSPLPWRQVGYTVFPAPGDPDEVDAVCVMGEAGETSVTCEHLANAALIVRAVNSHADLLAAAEAALKQFSTLDKLYSRDRAILAQLEAAIAKAKGQAS